VHFLGSSRNLRLALGNQTLYWRAYSQYLGSDPSGPVTFGTPATAVIGGGTPMADAAAFGQWNAARRLVERGARTSLWEAAALGLMDQVKRCFASDQPPSPDGITEAFWCACHGGQQRAAEYLLAKGADINWIGYDDLTPLDAASRSNTDGLVRWLRDRGARSAAS